jgi:membrane protein required for colicin V production
VSLEACHAKNILCVNELPATRGGAPCAAARKRGETVSRRCEQGQGQLAVERCYHHWYSSPRGAAVYSRRADVSFAIPRLLDLFARIAMEIYDICMLVVLVGATVFGAWKGMAWQVASAASLVLSYFVALRFSEQLAPRFGAQAPLNRFIAMAVLYAGTSIAIWVLFRMVAGIINRVKLKEFDRQMGAIFGAAKGILLCVAITFFAVTLSAQARGMVLESKSGHYIALFLDRAEGVMPQELHQVLDPYLNKLEKELEPGAKPEATVPVTIPATTRLPPVDASISTGAKSGSN